MRQDGTTVLPRSTEHGRGLRLGPRPLPRRSAAPWRGCDQAPAIVRVFDFLEANGTAYIVMELLEGETLERPHQARDGRSRRRRVDRILSPLLDGLEQVHAAGFLHRDIKPANIMLDASGEPTLIDFGASRAAMAGPHDGA